MNLSPAEIADEHRYIRDAQTISILRIAARNVGYALVVHGSRGPKDLDLVAIPWTIKAVSPLILLQRLIRAGGLLRAERISEKSGIIKPNKPHGRVATILMRPTDHRHIDLSIITPRRK
jgi:hypothetical protein